MSFFYGMLFLFWVASPSIFALEEEIKEDVNVYKYINRNSGDIEYSDRRHRGKRHYQILTLKGWVDYAPNFWSVSFRARQEKYKHIVHYYATQHKLSKALLHAVITAESSYREDALSKAGAMGLMQLMPATAARYGVDNAWNASQNIAGGSRYLRDLLDLFDGDLSLALAAYNAGENAVQSYGNKIPPYPETQNYVKKVMQYLAKYRSESSLSE